MKISEKAIEVRTGQLLSADQKITDLELRTAVDEALPRPLNDFYASSGVRSDLGNFDASFTRQEFADECDINTIMAQYEKHGVVSHINPRQPYYADLSELPDLATALRELDKATVSFMSLPAKVRAEFENDPVKFVEFAENAENIEQLRTWGLAKPPEAPQEPLSVRVIPDPVVPPPVVTGEPKPA